MLSRLERRRRRGTWPDGRGCERRGAEEPSEAVEADCRGPGGESVVALGDVRLEELFWLGEEEEVRERGRRRTGE